MSPNLHDIYDFSLVVSTAHSSILLEFYIHLLSPSHFAPLHYKLTHLVELGVTHYLLAISWHMPGEAVAGQIRWELLTKTLLQPNIVSLYTPTRPGKPQDNKGKDDVGWTLWLWSFSGCSVLTATFQIGRSVGGKNIYGVKRQMQGYMKDQGLDNYMCSNPFEGNIR